MCDDVTARHDSSGAVQKQTAASIHAQPVMTSSPVPVTSAQVPMTSQHPAAAAGMAQSSRQRLAMTADSMTFSHTTLYACLMLTFSRRIAAVVKCVLLL